MRFIGLLMVAGVIGFSHSAEGQRQNLDGGQGVIWVEGGIDSEAPENAIRVLIGGGYPLCRGMHSENAGHFWRDIGIVNPANKCHTLRGNKQIRLQEEFYYLVPAETEGEVSTDEVQAAVAKAIEGGNTRIAAVRAQLEKSEEREAYLLELLDEVRKVTHRVP